MEIRRIIIDFVTKNVTAVYLTREKLQDGTTEVTVPRNFSCALNYPQHDIATLVSGIKDAVQAEIGGEQ